MKVIDVICSKGKGGFFYDDQMAIRHGAESDGAMYKGKPETPGFASVRQASESISVMLVLEDGQIAVGDCVAVQYSGSGGRDPLLSAERYIPFLKKYVAPKLVGREMKNFRELAAEFDALPDPETGKPMHTALRYGVTGALLDAVALAQRKTMAEVIAAEYGTTVSKKLIPIYAQSGDDRHMNVDKMILKGVDVLPHGLINNVRDKLGEHGEKLLEFVSWIVKRIDTLNTNPGYKPTLHFDVYGTLGLAFGEDNYAGIADYLAKIKEAAKGMGLRIEFPIDGGSREATIKHFAALMQELRAKNINVDIVADEWCNTLDDIKAFVQAGAGNVIHIKTPDLGGINNAIEAVLYCNANGFGAFLGGSCTETEISGRMAAHVAMATSPIQTIAKPGMAVDEGFMILYNEMQRILQILK